MFHLSYIPYVPNLTVTKTPTNPNVVQLTCGVGSALGTTAYLISSTALSTITAHHSIRGYYAAIPDVMAELFPSSRYAARPAPGALPTDTGRALPRKPPAGRAADLPLLPGGGGCRFWRRVWLWRRSRRWRVGKGVLRHSLSVCEVEARV